MPSVSVLTIHNDYWWELMLFDLLIFMALKIKEMCKYKMTMLIV